MFKAIITAAVIFFAGSYSSQAESYSAKELNCLALNAHMEARGEGIDGMIAVSEVVLNRVKSKRWPNTICEVVYDDSQFSWTLMSSRYQIKALKDGDFNKAIHAALMSTYSYDRTNGANHYYSTIIKKPSWARGMEETYRYGKHVFFRD